MFEQSPLVGFGTASAATHAMEIVVMLLIAFALGYVLARVMDAARRSPTAHKDVAELSMRKNPLTTTASAVESRVTTEANNTPAPATTDAQPIAASSAALMPAEPSPPVNAAAPPSTARDDNLKKIEGIGPKIERILHNCGIHTFAQLAASDEATLRNILLAESERFRLHSPRHWPQQAALARDADWDGLKKLQQSLRAARDA